MKANHKNILSFTAIILFLIGAIASSNDNDSSETSDSNYINGLAPVDVYQNLENQGFTTDKQLGGEYGNTWTSTNAVDGIEYRVETFSSNHSNVENVRATALIDLSRKKLIAAQQFFVFISSLPYDNADPIKAGQWVRDNYDNDNATTIIGDAKFTIYTPSEASRVLLIEKAK